MSAQTPGRDAGVCRVSGAQRYGAFAEFLLDLCQGVLQARVSLQQERRRRARAARRQIPHLSR